MFGAVVLLPAGRDVSVVDTNKKGLSAVSR